jgi:hypothetical protein
MWLSAFVSRSIFIDRNSAMAGKVESVMPNNEQKSSALPKAYIVPIRLGIYSVLAACSGFVYFNVGDLVLTHYLIIVSIVAVSAMVLLDCRVSDDYWKREAVKNNDSGGQSRGA